MDTSRNWKVTALIAVGVALCAPSSSICQMPGPINNLVANASTDTTITIIWEVTAIIERFEVVYSYTVNFCKAPASSTMMDIISNGTVRSHILSGLNEDSEYNITVRAINSEGSTMATITVNTESVIPGVPPRRVEFTGSTSTSITLTWKRIDCFDRNGRITNYRIEYGITNFDTTVITSRALGADRTFTAFGLVPLTTYMFRLAAVNRDGMGPYSATVNFQTQDGADNITVTQSTDVIANSTTTGTNSSIIIGTSSSIIAGTSSSIIIGTSSALSIVFIVLLISTAVIILALCLRRKFIKKANLDESTTQFDSSSLTTERHEIKSMVAVRRSLRMHVSECMIVNSCNLELNESVGQGEFGIVYKGKMSEGFNKPFDQIVAVKTLKGFLEGSRVRNLLRECNKMSSFDHPNVLTLIGVCLDGGPAPYLVMPFMFNGNLLSYLKNKRDDLVLPPQQEMDSNGIAVCSILVDMCLQVAKGMKYLASQRVVHCDLAARNCMIDINFVVKVADFGLSETIDPCQDSIHHDNTDIRKLPAKWLAPECLNDGIFSEKSDVWAFGVTCWEVFSGGKIPYSGINTVNLLYMLEDGYRMNKPDNFACDQKVFDIVTQCWEGNSENRPTFSDVVTFLSTYLEGLSDYTVLSEEKDKLQKLHLTADIML